MNNILKKTKYILLLIIASPAVIILVVYTYTSKFILGKHSLNIDFNFSKAQREILLVSAFMLWSAIWLICFITEYNFIPVFMMAMLISTITFFN